MEIIIKITATALSLALMVICLKEFIQHIEELVLKAFTTSEKKFIYIVGVITGIALLCLFTILGSIMLDSLIEYLNMFSKIFVQ